MAVDLSINSETAALKCVVIGYPNNFHDMPFEVVNKTQRAYYSSPLKPTKVFEGQIDIRS